MPTLEVLSEPSFNPSLTLMIPLMLFLLSLMITLETH
jgi:hypothetical protein